ncbi:GNAT family N-acetyltransferase [Lachnoclostridium sp. MSJ-17]|uniref:GNAT family N-acetyltransferase n=1 Tax=Lachnoclostridium sp. MSJ-17 TaxID=2841516 RepID=UPI001C0FABD3|nr:GNAT family N-acetyltransferase [Lachnoclostridium sp. MSJ-17]MBU5462912.1 GNAT family N-acetyltransferase [Lachnoclostridium sp. MSJ-17]
MIQAVSEGTDFAGAIRAFSSLDPFACRILSLYRSYRPGLAFVDYWLELDDSGKVTGAIARNGANFILFLTDKSALDEICSFVRISGAAGIICSGAYDLDLSMKKTSGAVLIRNAPFDSDEGLIIIEPDLRSAYDLIFSCSGEGFQPPAFEDFYVDMNHRIRHGTARIRGVKHEGRLAAVAMTVAESDDGAVLGAVACAKEYRRLGYASTVVKSITNSLVSEGKSVFLHRAKNENISFYSGLGFTECGTWQELIL